jgi:uncharacterized coiled-coil protein SlyX
VAKRKESIDFMKFVPLVVMAVSLVSGYTMLNARVSNAEEKLREQDAKINTQSSDSAGIQISQARLETKLDNLVEYLKEKRNQ